jgi:hypothetical protein
MEHIKLWEDWATPYTKELSGITPADLDENTFVTQARKYIKLGKADALGHLVALFLRKYGDANKARDPEQDKILDVISKIEAEAEEEGITIPGFSDGSFDSASTKAASKDYDSAVKSRDFIKTKQEVEENIRKMTSDLSNYITKNVIIILVFLLHPLCKLV